MKTNIFSIAPHGDFLDVLVKGVLDGPLLGDWPRSNPFWLSDVTIILPTKRARLALSEKFANAMNGATLLPDIRTLGGEIEDEELFLGTDDTPLPSAISPLARRFILARLVENWTKKNGGFQLGDLALGVTNPARILSLTDSLANLIDDFEIENVSPSAIRSLVPDDLADNWRQTLKFLEIAMTAWPQILAERGQLDAVALRDLDLGRRAKSLATLYGDRPVIAAGSTGSLSATAKLLKAVSELPRGALVLPGLNTGIEQAELENLKDQNYSPHGHPQYGLMQLLAKLERKPAEIVELADPENTRTELVRHALALAENTATWYQKRTSYAQNQVTAAVSGLSVVAAPNEQTQALAIALAARDAIEHKKTVGIIAPDRTLARRVAAELARFNIEVDDNAGVPLFHSRAGRLARQILSLAVTTISPLDLISLLRNRYVTLGRERKELAQTTNLIEVGLLRGQRPKAGFSGLREILSKNLDGKIDHVAHVLTAREGEIIAQLIDDLDVAMEPILSVLKQTGFSSAALVQALAISLNLLTIPANGNASPNLPGGAELADWARSFGDLTEAGPLIEVRTSISALQALMAGFSVRTPGKGRPDIVIWGRLEARLQSADLIILSALNEGKWPEIADPGPWLSRGMRLGVGLEPPERQHGLAAHDFEMALGNPTIVLSFAKRLGTNPALPSRLLQRLLAFLGSKATQEMTSRGEKWLDLAHSLDRAKSVSPASRPAPKPPAALRPKSISITEIETLFRSPYDLYAKYCLGLRPLDPLAEQVGAREKGSFIHDIFEKFVVDGHDPDAPDAQGILQQLAEQVFADLDGMDDRREIWKRRFKTSATAFIEFERSRSKIIKTRFAEQKLRWTFPIGDQKFTLRGRADRIDVLNDTTLAILDFKTGGVPSNNEMRDFLAPQLLAEAAIVVAVGFENQPPASASELTYIKIGAGPTAFLLTPFALVQGLEINDAVDAFLQILFGRVQALLLSDDHAMHARLIPKAGQTYRGAYEHLARTEEWTQIDAEGEGA